jgi:hypothetical protein
MPTKRTIAKTTKTPRLATPRTLERGETIEAIVLARTRRELTRKGLHDAFEPAVRDLLKATCSWKGYELGDYRFLIFETEVARDTLVYVQFWSEPDETVCWEVSSGRWNPPADKWLAGERSKRIEAFGFEIGGRADNYGRELRIDSARAIAQVASTVVDIFYDAFDYRGATPIRARMHFDGRSEVNRTHDALTPQDLAKMFTRARFHVQERWDEDEQGEESPTLRCRTMGTSTVVEFGERVGEENLYRAARLTVNLPPLPEITAEMKKDGVEPDDIPDHLEARIVLSFGGGVTTEWIGERITEWRDMIASHRRELRRQARRALVRTDTAPLVH